MCLIDSCTRFPFAFPLRAVTAKAVCDSMLQVFSLVGAASIITSDQGTCFTAELTQQFLKLLGCSPRLSTPLQPEGNFLVERLNQSVKRMLHHVCQSNPRQWHKLLTLVLRCFRESKNETLRVSPQTTVIGRNSPNPLKLIQDSWTRDDGSELPPAASKSVPEYIIRAAKEFP